MFSSHWFSKNNMLLYVLITSFFKGKFCEQVRLECIVLTAQALLLRRLFESSFIKSPKAVLQAWQKEVPWWTRSKRKQWIVHFCVSTNKISVEQCWFHFVWFLQWLVSFQLQLQQLWVSVQTIESAVGICLQLCTNLHQCVTVKPHLKWVGCRCHKACLWDCLRELAVLFLIASLPHPDRNIIKIATCWTLNSLDWKCDLGVNKP